jgi:hypothetical protein
MGRPVKHIQLHRIGPTELRVVSDVDAGVLPVVEREEAVIRGFQRRGGWPHRQVSLFVLRDLTPLARQLQGGALPPGGVAALNTRTVVNLFDLADPRACHVYVNQHAMVKEGYWDDQLAIEALLAHEHAHPLAEGPTTRASRALAIELARAEAGEAEPRSSRQDERLVALLTGLIEQLCLYAPRELFTNELAIAAGFGSAMLHLNRRNVANAYHSVAGRAQLREVLLQDVAQGNRPAHEVGQLLLAGDLESHLKLAMETAPFARAGRPEQARELEEILEQELFPQLEPQVAPAFAALRGLYAELAPGLTVAALQAWADQVAAVVLAALAERGLALRCRVRPVQAN